MIYDITNIIIAIALVYYMYKWLCDSNEKNTLIIENLLLLGVLSGLLGSGCV